MKWIEPAAGRANDTALRAAGQPPCQRCGHPVSPRPRGCKNPCANCGTVYPLGDCSD